MSPSRACALLLVLVTGALGPGCALLSKADPGGARYFSLVREPVGPKELPSGVPGERGGPAGLRLGRIRGATHLEDRLVYRDSTYELGYHAALRWTEPPQESLQRLLTRALFEERGLRHAVEGGGPTLDAELTALDELRGPPHVARAQVVVRLHDERRVLWEETITVDRPIADLEGGDPALETVEALGVALQTLVEQVADRAVRELETER